MNPAVVVKAVGTRPFRKFVLHLAGGRSFPVPSPECIRFSKGTKNRLALVYPPSGATHVVDLFYVTDIEYPDAIIT